jgi:hypothetical protein
MKKFLKQRADNSENTMEIRDHLKNGANPKSLTSRGNKIIVTVIGFLLCFGLTPCLAQDIDPTKEVQTTYMRPSVTNVYIYNTNDGLAEKVIEIMDGQKILAKFNDHSLLDNVFYVSDSLTNDVIKAVLEEKVIRPVVQKWFPYDKDNKVHSTEVIEQRGIFNATDADVIAAKASARKDALLKDVGEELLNYSYIVVYIPYNIQKTSKKSKSYEQKGYKGYCKVSVWRLDWNEEVKTNFYNQWNQENAVYNVQFPIVDVVNLTMPISVADSPLRPLDYEALLNLFASEIISEANLRMAQKIEDFQVKAPISKVKINSVYAKIGTKESVTVDKRFFASEIRQDETGQQSLKRKGVVRATSKIAKNDTIATGEGPDTKFYQTYGKFLKEGMLLTEKPDLGIGITAMGGLSANARAEIGIGMYASKLMKKLKIPYGMKAYGQITYPFAKLQNDGQKITFDDKEQTFLVFSAGLSKDIYFAHILALTPYVGYSALLIPEKYSKSFEAYYTAAKKSPSGFEAGLNFTIAIRDNFQVVVNGGYNMVTGTWYKSPVQANVGLRYQL